MFSADGLPEQFEDRSYGCGGPGTRDSDRLRLCRANSVQRPMLDVPLRSHEHVGRKQSQSRLFILLGLQVYPVYVRMSPVLRNLFPAPPLPPTSPAGAASAPGTAARSRAHPAAPTGLESPTGPHCAPRLRPRCAPSLAPTASPSPHCRRRTASWATLPGWVVGSYPPPSVTGRVSCVRWSRVVRAQPAASVPAQPRTRPAAAQAAQTAAGSVAPAGGCRWAWRGPRGRAGGACSVGLRPTVCAAAAVRLPSAPDPARSVASGRSPVPAAATGPRSRSRGLAAGWNCCTSCRADAGAATGSRRCARARVVGRGCCCGPVGSCAMVRRPRPSPGPCASAPGVDVARGAALACAAAMTGSLRPPGRPGGGCWGPPAAGGGRCAACGPGGPTGRARPGTGRGAGSRTAAPSARCACSRSRSGRTGSRRPRTGTGAGTACPRGGARARASRGGARDRRSCVRRTQRRRCAGRGGCSASAPVGARHRAWSALRRTCYLDPRPRCGRPAPRRGPCAWDRPEVRASAPRARRIDDGRSLGTPTGPTGCRSAETGQVGHAGWLPAVCPGLVTGLGSIGYTHDVPGMAKTSGRSQVPGPTAGCCKPRDPVAGVVMDTSAPLDVAQIATPGVALACRRLAAYGALARICLHTRNCYRGPVRLWPIHCMCRADWSHESRFRNGKTDYCLRRAVNDLMASENGMGRPSRDKEQCTQKTEYKEISKRR